MKIYCAPLETITTYRFRKIHASLTSRIDKYFIPFLSPNGGGSLSARDEREIALENNIELSRLVPQIISKRAEETILLIERLQRMGYTEVNLNFGCPSGTVSSKGRGAGMLKDINAMEAYLTEVFARSPLPISIKTRIGFASPDEWDAILNVYNKFPIKELIIHPRTGKEAYAGSLHLDLLDGLDQKTNIPIVYNGEVKTKGDMDYLMSRFPYLSGIMVGRGLMEAPDMLKEGLKEEARLALIKDYINEICSSCLAYQPWGNALFPIKAFWKALTLRFEGVDKLKKKLLKAQKQDEFFAYAEEILKLPLVKNVRNGIAPNR